MQSPLEAVNKHESMACYIPESPEGQKTPQPFNKLLGLRLLITPRWRGTSHRASTSPQLSERFVSVSFV